MRVRSAMLLTTLLLATQVPLSAAGSEDDPEITDPSGDRTAGQSGQFGGIDVVAGWVEETETDFVFRIETSSTAAAGSTTEYSYTFHATMGDTTASATAIALNGGGVEADGDASTAEISGTTITLSVPKSSFGAGTALTQLYIETEAHLAAGGPSLSEDRAPDSGFGRDYVLAAPPVDDVVYHNLTGPTFLVESDAMNATSATHLYNWTAPEGALALNVSGNASGHANITLQWANGTLDVCNCTGQFDAGHDLAALDPPPTGDLQVRIAYGSFQGRLALSIAPAETGNGTGGPPTGNGTGNATSEAPGGTGIPLPVVATVGAVAAAAAVRRRW